MRLYVVSADTYNASWGTQISIFGVFNENHLADALEELQQKYNYNFEVNEANLNECTDIYLGGYLEEMKWLLCKERIYEVKRNSRICSR